VPTGFFHLPDIHRDHGNSGRLAKSSLPDSLPRCLKCAKSSLEGAWFFFVFKGGWQNGLDIIGTRMIGSPLFANPACRSLRGYNIQRHGLLFRAALQLVAAVGYISVIGTRPCFRYTVKSESKVNTE